MKKINLKNVSIPSVIFSYNFFPLTIIITTCLLAAVHTQCPQNCQSCSNSTTCTSCVSQNNLLINNGSLGCLPCPIRCQKCTFESSLLQCTTCSQGYYLDPYLHSCMRCKSSNCLQCNEYYPSQCIVCQARYFLEESTSTCKQCAIQYNWAKTCRQNFILTCQDGYYTTNGQVCLKCDTIGGCKTCVSGTICSQCFEGFYASSGKCLSCDSSCKTCNTNTSCTSCQKGFRINTSSKCQVCSTTNCAACSIQDVCLQCNSMHYFEGSNKTCILLDQKKSIQNCIRYASNFNNTITVIFAASTILCRTCANGTYFNLETNTCQWCSLLCENCVGMYRSSKCSSCNPTYGRLTDSANGICGNKLFTSVGQKTVYTNNRNDLGLFVRSGKMVNVSQGLLKCPGGQVASQVSLNLSNIAGYHYTVHVKLLIQTLNTPPFNITVLLNSKQILLQSIFSYQECNTIKIANFSFSVSVSQLLNNSSANSSFPINYNQPNLLNFKSFQPDELLIDIREMVILVKECHQSCALCELYESCIQCKNQSQYLEEARCVDKCDSGYFLYSLKGMCLLQCPKQTFPSINSVTWTCQLCSSSCSSCVSSTICTSCSLGFYLYQNQCLTTCPTTYFKNFLFGKCQKCTAPCDSCLSTKQCLSCQAGFYFGNNNTCLTACPDRFYGDFQSMTCQPCNEPCFTCKSQTSCLSCTSLSQLSYFGFMCLFSCPSQYFPLLNLLNQSSCLFCSFPCQECSGIPNKCTQCITGFLLSVNNTCLPQCPEQYFSSVTYSMCMECQKPCKNCINSQKLCISCVDGYLLMGNQCVVSCGEGFYKATVTECKLCKNECLSCISKDECTKCNQGYYLQDMDCLTQCNDGYYKIVSQIGDRICTKCNKNCQNCFGTNDYCLNCNINFFIQPNNTCSSNCGVTQLNPGCAPCDYPCYSCSVSTSNCTSCVNTYYFSLKTYQCVTQCYYGFYKAIEKGFGYCRPCVLPCTNCQSLSVCYSCSKVNETFYYLQSQSSTKKVCVSNCGIFEYKDDDNFICLKCVEPCLTCINATFCLSCINGILINGTCVSKVDGCPIGSYQIQSIQKISNQLNTTLTTCHSCPSQCSSCKSETVCTGCAKDFFLYGQNCIDHCPSGSAPIKQLRKCIFCEYPCAQCQGTSSYCTKCAQMTLNSSTVVCPQDRRLGTLCIKYYLMKGQCISECSSMSFPKGDQCVSCGSPCRTCTSETVCTSCVDSFYMLENSCYSICPEKYYAEALTEQCQKCIYPCNACKNQQQCLSCQEGYLFQSKCLIKEACPLGYFETTNNFQNKYCEICHSQCLACMDSKDYCLECSKISSHEGKCYDKCPNGYFSQFIVSSYLPNTTVIVCAECPAQCLTCRSNEKCESCVFSYSLLGGKCIKRCPPNYMQKFTSFDFSSNPNYTVSQCVACKQPCSECFLQDTLCESCMQGFYMYQQKCLLQCPQGTYLNRVTQSCKQCPFPCRTCEQKQRDILCIQCSKGYYVENNVCVDKCNQKFIDFDSKKCVSECSGAYLVEHILTRVKFCARQCHLPYLKDQSNRRCVTNCSLGEYISANYSCEVNAGILTQLIPKLRGHLFVDMRGVLNLYVEITRPVEFTDSLPIDQSIQITLRNQFQQSFYPQRMLQQKYKSQSSTINQSQSPISFSLTSQSSSLLIFSLYTATSVYYPSSISLIFKSNSHLYIIDKVSKLPLQSDNQKIQLKSRQFYEVYDYALVDKNKFGHVGEIIMDFVLILGLAMLLFNKFAKIYYLLIFSQSVFMLVCLDIPMPPNLYRFLQGFRYSHFYQLGNWFDTLQYERYTNFYGNNFNRIQSIFGDVAFIKVAGHLIGFYCIMIGLGLILYGIRYLPECKNEYINKLMGLMGEKFRHIKWSHLTDVFVSTFMLILVSFFFQTIDYTTAKTEQSLSIALSYIMLFTMLSYAIFYCYKTYKMAIESQKEPQTFIQSKYMYRQDYASFYQGISSPQYSYKNYMMVGKICTYGGLCGLLWNYPNFCLSVWIVIQIVYAVIYLQFRPFADDVQNYIYAGCGFVYALGMVLVIVVNQCQKPQSRFFVPESQQEKKILIGYLIIVLLLICTFLLIVEMVISIMRGNLKPKKLDGENQEYNEVKFNSPNSVEVGNILQPGPKKIQFEHKIHYKGYEIDNFSIKKDNQRTSIKEE